MVKLNDELTERGEFVEALAVTQVARTVTHDGSDRPVVTDGPFPESKELLAGYRIVDVESPERAIEIAAAGSAAPGPGGKPIERLTEYKRRMGWQFPYVSTYNSDFAFDFGLALTEEQAEEVPEIQQLLENPDEWLEEWSKQTGAELKDGLREAPSWIAFARENGTVYHTYTVMAPDPFVQPYFSFLLERTPKPQPPEPRAWRKDEYPD